VEATGLEPVTPCLQTTGTKIARCRRAGQQPSQGLVTSPDVISIAVLRCSTPEPEQGAKVRRPNDEPGARTSTPRSAR
jgi:hypothetical protein